MLVNEEEEEEGMLLLILLLLVLLLLMVVAVLVVDNMGWGEWQRKTGAWKWRRWLDHLLLSFRSTRPRFNRTWRESRTPPLALREPLSRAPVWVVCVWVRGTWVERGGRWRADFDCFSLAVVL